MEFMHCNEKEKKRKIKQERYIEKNKQTRQAEKRQKLKVANIVT